MRRLTERALSKYGLEQARIRFIAYTGNGLYQVTVPSGCSIAPGKYALRLHQPDYMKPKFIMSEMEWLSALHQQRIAVPMPVRNQDGEWLTQADGGYDIPQKRNCTLIGWTEGSVKIKNIRPHHFSALGRVIGKLHEQSKKWKRPRGFARPHWDWGGLYGNGFSYGTPAAATRSSIPKKHQVAFNDVLHRVHEASVQMGKGKNVYGLIHADLGLGDNVAFLRGDAQPFDFDDCGFGYWVFDFGVPLSQYMMDTNDTTGIMREALLEGYEETATLEEVGIEYLDLFLAARIAQFMFFYQASGMAHPDHMEEAKREVDAHGKYLKHLLKRLR